MGLRLLADCVAARGGSLQIESEPSVGTRLSLWIPTGRTAEPARTARRPPSSTCSRPARAGLQLARR